MGIPKGSEFLYEVKIGPLEADREELKTSFPGGEEFVYIETEKEVGTSRVFSLLEKTEEIQETVPFSLLEPEIPEGYEPKVVLPERKRSPAEKRPPTNLNFQSPRPIMLSDRAIKRGLGYVEAKLEEYEDQIRRNRGFTDQQYREMARILPPLLDLASNLPEYKDRAIKLKKHLLNVESQEIALHDELLMSDEPISGVLNRELEKLKEKEKG